jgi:hypothetical protein
MKIKTSFMAGTGFDGAFHHAADIDNGNTIDSTDYMKIKAYFMGIADLSK